MYYRSSRQKKQKGLEMNKKILLSLLIIGIIVSVASAGTWAYFSDTETSTANLEAGKLDLNTLSTMTLSDDKGHGNNDGYLVPGEKGSGTLTLTNSGTIPGDLYVKINPTNSGLLPYIKLTATVNGNNYDLDKDKDKYVRVADDLKPGDSVDVKIEYSMDEKQKEGQGFKGALKIDALLIQDGIKPEQL